MNLEHVAVVLFVHDDMPRQKDHGAECIPKACKYLNRSNLRTHYGTPYLHIRYFFQHSAN